MPSDPYRVLGLGPAATPAEVKRAYRALAKANHPDSVGEVALARFLAIQAAYEQLANAKGRPTGRSRAGARPPEPWRADPTRAGEARAGEARGGTRAPGPDRSTGARAKGSSSPGGPKTSAGGTRRRSSKKATFGSTTYGEAHAPDDPEWHGASWYGPSSGEYWTVNPREYADPRKHGPEYQARATTREEGAREAREAREARAATDARATSMEPPEPMTSTSFGFGFGATVARLDAHPIRRAVLALVAWPPLGIAAAALIGQATGCAAFSATCTSSEALYPWLAQVAILLALALLPGLARLLAGGTAAAAVFAFPVAAALSASGANYDRAYGPASLMGILAIVWLGGVLAMAIRTRRSRTAT